MDPGHSKRTVADTSNMCCAERTTRWSEGIQLDACPPLERLVVKTRNSEYELVIVSGSDGEVLIRGGQLFPEFRQARLVGATAGGHTLKVLGVYVGLCLELFVDRRTIITSPVDEVSRPPTAAATSRRRH